MKKFTKVPKADGYYYFRLVFKDGEKSKWDVCKLYSMPIAGNIRYIRSCLWGATEFAARGYPNFDNREYENPQVGIEFGAKIEMPAEEST